MTTKETTINKPENYSIERDLLDQVFSHQPLSLWANILNSAILAFVLRNIVPHTTILLWLVAVWLVTIVRTTHYYTYRHRTIFQDRLQLCKNLFYIGVIVSGSVWGWAGVLLFPVASYPHQAFIILLLGGMTAGSMVSFSEFKGPLAIYTSLLLLPIVTRLFIAGGETHITMGALTLLFGVFVLLTSLRIHKTKISATLLLQEKNMEILERRRIEGDLRVAQQAALHASQAKSDFLATMSHEIRTPMNGIIGMTDLALETELDPQQKFFLDTVKLSADSLLVLINDILDFSKIEAGKMDLDEHPFEPAKTVQAAMQTVQVLAKDKNLSLQVDIAPTVPAALRGDSLRLRQVLLNLLSNAVKFTHEGCIKVTVSHGAAANGKVELQVSVADTGSGIQPDMEEHIFGSFSQEETGITRKHGGTGLGLSICRQLCRLMGGDIGVKSNHGQGSIFSFTCLFSLADMSELTGMDDKEEEEMIVPPLHILLVDDNKINRQLAGFILEQGGHILTFANNGLEALEQLGQTAFNIILMDIQMPKIDGYTATKLIRGFEQGVKIKNELLSDELAGKLAARLHGDHLPIIAMTANAMSGDRDICIAHGMDDYLTKPFYPEDFNRLLAKWAKTVGN